MFKEPLMDAPKYINTFVIRITEDHVVIDFGYNRAQKETDPVNISFACSCSMSLSTCSQLLNQLRLLENKYKERNSG